MKNQYGLISQLDVRAKSLSNPSPNESGKSSPSYSGKSSPCSTIEDSKLNTSPRKKLLEIKTNIALTSKPVTGPKSPRSNLNFRDGRCTKLETECSGLLPINEVDKVQDCEIELTKISEESVHTPWGDLVEQEELHQALMPEVSETSYLLTFDQYSQTNGFDDEYLTLQQWRDKYQNGKNEFIKQESLIRAAFTHTTNKLDEMENQFLMNNTNQPSNLIHTVVTLSSENQFKEYKEDMSSSIERTKGAIAISAVNEVDLLEVKKAQLQIEKKSSNIFNRPTTMARPSNVNKQQINRKNLIKPMNLSVRSTNVPNIVVNPIRKFPLRTSMALHTIKTKPMTQNESSANKNTVKRPVTAVRVSGVPSNTASRLAARSKTMIDLGKNSLNNVNSSNISKASSRDSLTSSTSTLRASNDRISDSQTKINCRKSEPRTLPSKTEDEDGWLTVKARRRSSLHWSNRFNQPSGYASLPTLSLFSEKDSPKNTSKSGGKKDNKKVIKSTIGKSLESNSITQSLVNATATNNKLKSTSTVTVNSSTIESKAKSTMIASIDNFNVEPKSDVEKKSETFPHAIILQRQRSDITGLKLNNLRKEYFRSEKIKKMKDLKKVTTDEANCDHKTSMNIQTNMGLSTTMLDLYASCMDDEKTSGVLGKSDADNDEIESDENQRKLLEEQECLERQIFELQNTEIEIDTETDDADCDTILGLEAGEDEENDSIDTNDFDQFNDNLNLEAKYQHLLSDMSSGERIQTLATLQAFVSRHPGKIRQIFFYLDFFHTLFTKC